MRYVVLLFALGGVAGTGFISYRWGIGWQKEHGNFDKWLQEYVLVQKEYKAADPQKQLMMRNSSRPPDQLRADLVVLYTSQRMLPFMMGAAVLGLFGIVTVFTGRGLSSALLFAVLAGGPAVFDPKILLFTGSFAVAALCSLFVRPRRAAVRDEDDSEESDDPSNDE